MTAREIIFSLLTRIPNEIPGARIFRRNVGVAIAGDRRISFGTKGQSDLWGIAPGGIHFEIEVKSANDRLTPVQASYLEMINATGGIGLVARDVERTIADLKFRLTTHPANK